MRIFKSSRNRSTTDSEPPIPATAPHATPLSSNPNKPPTGLRKKTPASSSQQDIDLEDGLKPAITGLRRRRAISSPADVRSHEYEHGEDEYADDDGKEGEEKEEENYGGKTRREGRRRKRDREVVETLWFGPTQGRERAKSHSHSHSHSHIPTISISAPHQPHSHSHSHSHPHTQSHSHSPSKNEHTYSPSLSTAPPTASTPTIINVPGTQPPPIRDNTGHLNNEVNIAISTGAGTGLGAYYGCLTYGGSLQYDGGSLQYGGSLQ